MCRYVALRELIPSKEKADKATILMQVVDYVRQLQVRQQPSALMT